MPQNAWVSLVLGGFLVLASGCRPRAISGVEAFHEGRLPAAAAELRRLEPTFGQLEARDQARYALYRGLVELGLGNAAVADAWLGFAKRSDARDPGCFTPHERGQLLSAWRASGRMPGELR
jgi:hypothetical protein